VYYYSKLSEIELGNAFVRDRDCSTSQSKPYQLCMAKTSGHMLKSMFIFINQVIKTITAGFDWIKVIRGTLCGVEHLHSKQNIIHNEDNIVFGQTAASKSIQTIDFGKACKISDGKFYTLSVADKEKYMQKHS